ncbi:asparagine synthase (glutamine-hydrolyzing) [Marivirga sp. S37H4]|uniref:asparagine synthase (glutamine-hydrolyzing) n=1 Tax=Marivirga aurantiaca TaxID=2802615 RepID=A0A934X1M2_9BACT|nr:asparagine synthase (glutamine-hydrolyzing) [Marivirga aurantiaca]MBK6266730.1 asparagine synthase (glutamine-hydrolyzing) [Marivirga aurantiaca]
MCGITGIFAFNEIGRFNLPNLSLATEELSHRGPDHQNIYVDEFVGLGHRRLSVIDLSSAGNQPMSAHDGRYQIVFNGEIYNYKQLRQDLTSRGVTFQTESDTEVLLQMLIHHGADALPQLNGFFAFAFYDVQKQEILLARDRYGIKPLYYFKDEDRFIFGSELKAIMKFGIEKKVDANALFTYLQLNYLPAPMSMVKGVKKLMPGQYAVVKKKSVEINNWYQLKDTFGQQFSGTYNEAQEKLRLLMNQSVERRLVADVPLGTFLSGGVDSSIISALVAEKTNHLHTFSIGYKGHSYFDETEYANAVAKHIGSEHQVFQLSLDDLYTYLPKMLRQFSEPFADSSALPVYALSQLTKEKVTVALSGDGADELFGGYNKHAALYRLWHPGLKEKLAGSLGFLWNLLPKSRNNPLANKARQLSKFAEASKLDVSEQVWLLASLQSGRGVTDILSDDMLEEIDFEAFDLWKSGTLNHITQPSINQALQLDQQLVLQGDMLQKVDLMSMAHALEVRVPFLDHELVAFANSLPEGFKVNGSMKKRILQDTFRDKLPAKIYNRPKHGFEVPLLSWLQNQLKGDINNKWLSQDFIESQAIFDVEGVEKLKRKLFSSDPGDSHAHVWALICFQEWWNVFMK